MSFLQSTRHNRKSTSHPNAAVFNSTGKLRHSRPDVVPLLKLVVVVVREPSLVSILEIDASIVVVDASLNVVALVVVKESLLLESFDVVDDAIVDVDSLCISVVVDAIVDVVDVVSCPIAAAINANANTHAIIPSTFFHSVVGCQGKFHKLHNLQLSSPLG
jgi:hypothetical protein